MALIKCNECGNKVSDKALTCPNCGAPINQKEEPKVVKYNSKSDTFYGTMSLIVKLAMKAIQEHGWTIEQANENVGLVTFKTGISWGSWSGVTGSLNISEISENTFKVTGTGKQNVSGGQLVAMNIGNEAKNKAKKVIKTMQRLAEKE